MFNGKMKAVTFSYDDGVKQDIRFIEMLDKYGLKCTFNLNSERTDEGVIKREDYARVYKNHEVAVHTLNHPFLDRIEDDNEVIRQVEEDRLNLEKAVGYPVHGMAYPYGTGAAGERIEKLVRENTGVLFSRGTKATHSFDVQSNLICFEPTVHHGEWDDLFRLAHEFIALKPDTPKVFYIWGHTYEFDRDEGIYWDKMEEFCRLISGHDDIFYGTNTEILLSDTYLKAAGLK